MTLHDLAEEWRWQTENTLPQPLERLAVVYVRPSTWPQVLAHQESTRLPYRLVRRAVALGWAEAQVLVIDEDLGRSGTSVEGRHGFQRLVAEVGLAHVGLILGVELSRLARSSKDWPQLLEICALFGTLIADLDGVYNPSPYNDRLLLGLTGTVRSSSIGSSNGYIRANCRRPGDIVKCCGRTGLIRRRPSPLCSAFSRG